jgi:hypothetical protein
METANRIRTFREFWPFYVGEHRNPVNRALHFVGSTLVIVLVTAAVMTGDLELLVLAPIVGYGFAWVGHFRFEKNRPATFTYPAYSLAADYVMWWKIATCAMGRELQALDRK